MVSKKELTEDFNLSSLSAPQLVALIEKAKGLLSAKREEELEAIKQEMAGRLSQLDLTLDDLIPHKSPKRGRKSSSAHLEAPEKGATYRNPADPAETWTAGVKKGRAPAWVTDLRERGELHQHKAPGGQPG